MPQEIYPDENGPDVYDDFEEHVDQDQHESVRAFARRKKALDDEARERREDHLDEYTYGEDSGEAFDQDKPA